MTCNFHRPNLTSAHMAKSRKPLIELAIALCTVGGALFGIGAAKEPISRIASLPDAVHVVFIVIGGVLGIIGALVFALSHVIDPLRSAVSVFVYGDADSRYVVSYARSRDLVRLHALYEEYFGDEAPKGALMREWIAKRPSALTIVQRLVGSSHLGERRELVGSFKVLPLTRRGQQAVESGRVTGSTLGAEHIAGPRSRPAGYYVGDVVATTQVARGVVMAHIESALPTQIQTEVTVYARPLTPDGLRVMKAHGFVLVSDSESAPQIGRMCKLHAGVKRTARRRARKRLVAEELNATATVEKRLHLAGSVYSVNSRAS